MYIKVVVKVLLINTEIDLQICWLVWMFLLFIGTNLEILLNVKICLFTKIRPETQNLSLCTLPENEISWLLLTYLVKFFWTESCITPWAIMKSKQINCIHLSKMSAWRQMRIEKLYAVPKQTSHCTMEFSLHLDK